MLHWFIICSVNCRDANELNAFRVTSCHRNASARERLRKWLRHARRHRRARLHSRHWFGKRTSCSDGVWTVFMAISTPFLLCSTVFSSPFNGKHNTNNGQTKRITFMELFVKKTSLVRAILSIKISFTFSQILSNSPFFCFPFYCYNNTSRSFKGNS